MAPKCSALISILIPFTMACNRPVTDNLSHGKGESRCTILNDFESATDLRNWKGTMTLDGDHPSHGRKCCRLSADRGESLWIEAGNLPDDWRPYDLLKFDIFNPSSRLLFGSIRIYDRMGTDEEAEFHGQSYSGEGKVLLCPGWNHYEFRIQNAHVEEGNRMLQLEKIRKLTFSFGAADTALYMDNLRLVKGTESSRLKSRTDPHDCRVVIDDRNVYPSLEGPAEKIRTSRAITDLRKAAGAAVEELRSQVRIAELQGFQTLYQRIPLITADVGTGIRSKLVWFRNEEEEKKILDYVITSCNRASREISDMLSSAETEVPVPEPENDVSSATFYVPPLPSLDELKPSGGFYTDRSGKPVLIFSMLQINDGPLMDYFAPFNHRIESYTVGGGSRYNIEKSPVYDAFHKDPGSHRVGWDGWCGHLIKDRWAMGGKKEDVVICLENLNIRNAVLEYMKIHSSEWTENPDLLYNIMAYELQYICYCDKSQDLFRVWLRAQYGSIEKLNRCWQTAFRSFGEIRAPDTKNARPADNVNRAAWHDWAVFNTRRFTDYLIWVKSEMRRLDPETPVCAGGTSSMLSSSNSVTGIDEEMIINEVDDVILNESGGSPIFSDLLLSLSDSKKVMADPEMGGSTHGLLLQFLHGKSDISKWWWAGMPSSEYPHMNESSLPHSKEISLSDIDEVLRIALDIRRLAPEITEFTKHDPEIALLYSKTSIVQVPPDQIQSGETPYTVAVNSAWEGARFLGCRIGFVSEKQIIEGRLDKIKLLIVPAVKYIGDDIIARIEDYVEKGGIALIIPESFNFDQYANERHLTGFPGMKITGVTIPEAIGLGEKKQNYDQSFSQSLIYGEVRLNITTLNEDIFTGEEHHLTLQSDGLVQEIDPGKNKVLARFDNGKPALILLTKGKGAIYYLASPLKSSDYHILLSLLAEKAGLLRPVVAMGEDGKLVTGAEVRSAERERDILVYASNLTSDTVKFRLQGKFRILSALDLRSMKVLPSSNIVLAPYQETILKIEK